MNKATKIIIMVVGSLALLTGITLGVLKYGFGIDVFDQSGWEVREDGRSYYLDYHGDPMTDWQLVDGSWYYLDPSQGGAKVTGWLELAGCRYYLDANGVRGAGWLKLSEGTYYAHPTSGVISTGWLEQPEGRYYMGEDGNMVTGWIQLDKRYYLTETGPAATGWLELEGERYYLDNTGAMQTGWQELADGRIYLDPDTGAMVTGWLETDEGRMYLKEDGYLATGWTDIEESRYYFNENGIPVTGWLDTDDGRYYLDENGLLCTGWQQIEDATYYFHEDGTMAVGRITLDGANYHFDSRGKYVLLVNKWNPVPEGYEPELKTYKGWSMDASCYDAMVQMLTDLADTGYYYKITSVYRSEKTQEYIWNKRYNGYIASGYSKEKALDLVSKSVAVPGTSEHHLGLAIDITGDNAKKWLAEHCWEYGFIVRYPEGKTEITGIIYEPWHYRYVGVELAMELKDSGLCLEEYMDALTKTPAAPPDATPPAAETPETGAETTTE